MTSSSALDTPLVARLLQERELLPDDRLAAFREALTLHPKSPEEALIRTHLVDEATVARAHAEHLGIGWLDLRSDGGEYLLVSHRGDEETVWGPLHEIALACWDVADLISETICRKYSVMPVAVREGRLDLACLNPSHFGAIEEIRMRAGCVVQPHAVTLSLLSELSTATFGNPDVVREIASEGEGAEAEAEAVTAAGESGRVLDLQQAIPHTKDSQVLRIVNHLLAFAIDEDVSDIHLEPFEDAVRVRYRIDGKLRETTPPPASMFVPALSRLKILARMDIAEKRVPQDGAIAVIHKGGRVDLRVSTVPTVYGEKMVIRLLKKEGIPDSLAQLGFSETQSRDFLQAARSPHGLVFVTGPTGSGKSTTLYCCLNLINDPTENIVTVEDPVEYKFFGLNQVHVHKKVGLDFASTLRAFLRQDPDKIMVGEVRDTETAQICMRAALTGHLVLSTLHTNSALQVISRLVDMGVEPFLLGPALRLVEAQRLVRKLCPECRQAYVLPADVALRHGLEPDVTLYRPREGSCDACRGLGHRGRVGLYEVVPITDGLHDLIASGSSPARLEAAVRESGVALLADDAREKLVAGVTSLEEVSQYIRVNT